MKTTYTVTITTGRRTSPDPQTTTGQHEAFQDALSEAHTYARHRFMSPSVITVWARQGRNMWPVRILFPDTAPDGIPYPLGASSPDRPYYMVDTSAPHHSITTTSTDREVS